VDFLVFSCTLLNTLSTAPQIPLCRRMRGSNPGLFRHRHWQSDALTHKVPLYKECHSVCPLVGIGTLPTSLSPASVPSPQNQEGHTRLRVRGWWESPEFRRQEKKLSTLASLCSNHSVRSHRWPVNLIFFCFQL
jgi:hypothetical protein